MLGNRRTGIWLNIDWVVNIYREFTIQALNIAAAS